MDWKYTKITNPEPHPSITLSSFINNVIKKAVREISEYSEIEIEGPVSIEEDDIDAFNRNLRFVVKRKDDRYSTEKVRRRMNTIRENLRRYLVRNGELEVEPAGNPIVDNTYLKAEDGFGDGEEEREGAIEQKGLRKILLKEPGWIEDESRG